MAVNFHFSKKNSHDIYVPTVFHACLHFARSTIAEEKWGTTRNLGRKFLLSRHVNHTLFSFFCHRYLGHVDLMKFLVESNCGDIPSLRDLMHPDSAR